MRLPTRQDGVENRDKVYCVNISNFETHKSRYLQPKGSFFCTSCSFSHYKITFFNQIVG